MKYLLPCNCGRHVVVGMAEAGLTVTCECGASLSVPTLRHLAALEPAAEERARARRPSWGPWQATVFVALIVTVASAGAAGYLVLFPPPPPTPPTSDALEGLRPDDIRAMSPARTLVAWQLIRGGITQADPRQMAQYEQQREDHEQQMAERRRWLTVVLAIAVAGVVVTLAGAIGSLGRRS